VPEVVVDRVAVIEREPGAEVEERHPVHHHGGGTVPALGVAEESIPEEDLGQLRDLVPTERRRPLRSPADPLPEPLRRQRLNLLGASVPVELQAISDQTGASARGQRLRQES